MSSVLLACENSRPSSLKEGQLFSQASVFSTVVLIGDTVNKQTNIANRTKSIKNTNCWEADKYQHRNHILKNGHWTEPAILAKGIAVNTACSYNVMLE